MKLSFAPTLLAAAMLAPVAAWSQVSVVISVQPPMLPIYEQPQNPGDGYLWTPGYWGWNADDRDYYWIPGTWVQAPTPGHLWTPGYWAYYGGGYRWNGGYWGTRVGFYGGIDYGHGYNGRGYYGGRWERGAFHYNTAVNNVNPTVVRNVYNTKIVNNTTYNITRVSYNGGTGGVKAQPTAAEVRVKQEKHLEATPNQVEHERTAMRAPAQRASVNHGVPQVAATPKASALGAPEAVKASNAAETARQGDGAGKRKEHAAVQPGATVRGDVDADAVAQQAARREQRQAARGGEAKAQPGTKAEAQAAEQPAQAAQAKNKPAARPQADDAQPRVQAEPRAAKGKPQQPDDAQPRVQAEPRAAKGKAQQPADDAQPRVQAEPRAAKGKAQQPADAAPTRTDAEPRAKGGRAPAEDTQAKAQVESRGGKDKQRE